MKESFCWWQCSNRYIIFLLPHLHTPFSPSLIILIVSVNGKHQVLHKDFAQNIPLVLCWISKLSSWVTNSGTGRTKDRQVSWDACRRPRPPRCSARTLRAHAARGRRGKRPGRQQWSEGGPARSSGKKDFGSIPLRLFSLIRSCGLSTLSCELTCPSQLMKHPNRCHRCPSWCRSHAGGDSVALGRSVSLFPHPLSSGSAPTHPGDNSALNTFNQHAKQSLQQLFGASSLADFTHGIRFPNSR